jgi:glycosyltransferase involved in cell wall biosynthesis
MGGHDARQTPVLKALLMIGSLELGGAERQLVSLVCHLQSRGVSCHVFTLEAHGPLEPELTRAGARVYSAGLEKGDLRRRPWKILGAQLKSFRVTAQIRPSVVHAFLPLISFMGALSGRITGVPLVITARRALGTHQQRLPFLRLLDKAAYAMSHWVTVNSDAVKQDLVQRDRVDPGKIVRIYNGLDLCFPSSGKRREQLRNRFGIRDGQSVVSVVANLIAYKGHLDFLQAARLVIRRHPDVVFWLIGEDRGIGPMLKHCCQCLGLANHVRFFGQRNDVADMLRASDLSVLASHEEGFSNVILESMAEGLPVVATDVGGNAEAVEHGSTGWLVPARRPDLMAEKILDLLLDPQKARTWGKRGRDRVLDSFSMARMVDRHLNLYAGCNPWGKRRQARHCVRNRRV